jgi:hypothetical protein
VIDLDPYGPDGVYDPSDPYDPDSLSTPPADHATRAADHVLALIVGADPTFVITPDRHDAMVALVQAVARAVAAGGER